VAVVVAVLLLTTVKLDAAIELLFESATVGASVSVLRPRAKPRFSPP
jgi:hypothetical protein